MSLSRSHIEYILNPDGSAGYSWPILTGCNQPLSTCATRPSCWARGLHRRFKEGWAKLYNPDFSLKFNEDLLDAPFSLRRPSTIAVAFTGDMFGPGSENFWSTQERILGRVWQLPQHTFLFLTKSPENLARLNPWPPNAWVGASATGLRSWWKASELMGGVIASVRFISLEPFLEPIELPPFMKHLDWLIIGGQSGRGAKQPRLEWVLDILRATEGYHTKVWLKKKLLELYPQLPKGQGGA